MNREDQLSANLRARAPFESMVGTAADGVLGGAVECASPTAGVSANGDSAANAARLIALLLRVSGFRISRCDPSPKGTLLDFSTLVIYLIVGGLIIGSALLGF